MPRELAQIQNDPAPDEIVRLPLGARIRVLEREQTFVRYRVEIDGVNATTHSIRPSAWPGIIAGGTPLEPKPGLYTEHEP